MLSSLGSLSGLKALVESSMIQLVPSQRTPLFSKKPSTAKAYLVFAHAGAVGEPTVQCVEEQRVQEPTVRRLGLGEAAVQRLREVHSPY
jgi:hypothetical protein